MDKAVHVIANARVDPDDTMANYRQVRELWFPFEVKNAGGRSVRFNPTLETVKNALDGVR